MSRRCERETAVAFGDEPSRDIEAEFGATARVDVSVPKAAVRAPVLSAATKSAPVKPAPPKPPAARKPLPLPAPAGSAAQTGNFLEATGKPLGAPRVQAPALSAAQKAANAKALAVTAQTRVRQAAQATASSDAAYQAKRAAEAKTDAAVHANLLATSPEYAAREKYIRTAGVDTGQITMGAKVLATGAAIIASGGAVAGAVGLTTGGAALASAAAADKLLAAVDKGGAIAAQAKGALQDVKTAAAKGNAVAKQAVATVEAVAKQRVAALVPKGVEQALTGAARDAANQVVDKLSGAGGAALAAAASSAPNVPGKPPAPVLIKRRAAVAANKDAAAVAARLMAAPRALWLVSDAGKVSNVQTTPAAASGKGYLVLSSGKVVRQ
jgi:hypothetical protein